MIKKVDNMRNHRKLLLMYLSLFLIIGYCNVQESIGGNAVNDFKKISMEQWNNLAKKKIYFGHQSVGYNIIDGIQIVMNEFSEINLNIIETRDISAINGSVFSHSKVGRNEDPFSKTDDFVKVMESGVGGKADIAFHKYCYIDVNANTDVEKVFSNYQERINYLKLKYPETKFVHISMPLTTVQTGLKAWIKKNIGKPVGGIDANIKRNMFNKLLVMSYQGKDPVFDLAMAEATQPDGQMVTFTKEGEEYLTMYKGYSDDGGHLNRLGQKVIAEQLLLFLADVN